MGLLILDVPPKVDAWLDEQACRSAMPKNELALKVLKEAAGTDRNTSGAPDSNAEILKLLRVFDRWCQTQPIRTGHPIDDSRESLYD